MDGLLWTAIVRVMFCHWHKQTNPIYCNCAHITYHHSLVGMDEVCPFLLWPFRCCPHKNTSNLYTELDQTIHPVCKLVQMHLLNLEVPPCVAFHMVFEVYLEDQILHK